MSTRQKQEEEDVQSHKHACRKSPGGSDLPSCLRRGQQGQWMAVLDVRGLLYPVSKPCGT